MTDRISVLIFEPGKHSYIKTIDNTLKAMQQIVGGYIECVTLSTNADGSNLVAICNEEGKLIGLPECVTIKGIHFVGNVIIGRTEGENFVNLVS